MWSEVQNMRKLWLNGAGIKPMVMMRLKNKFLKQSFQRKNSGIIMNVGQEEWNSCNSKGVDLDILIIGSSATGKSNLKLYDKGTGGNK